MSLAAVAAALLNDAHEALLEAARAYERTSSALAAANRAYLAAVSAAATAPRVLRAMSHDALYAPVRAAGTASADALHTLERLAVAWARLERDGAPA